MGRTSLIFRTAAAAVMVAGLAACNSSGCLDNGSALPLAGFYSSSTGGAIALDSLQISGLGAPNDSVLATPTRDMTQVYLPMRSTADATTWVIEYKYADLDYPQLNDTLTFRYTSIPYFASEACGAMYIYDVKAVECTSHLIDSVMLTDSLMTNVDIERIRIYFRTAVEGGEQ